MSFLHISRVGLARPLLSSQTPANLRWISSSRVAWADAIPAAPPLVSNTELKAKKPIGGFRGGVFGFLLGFSLASSYASYHLLEEYKLASAQMQASVEELQASTQKVSAHVRRIEAVEKDLKALAESTSSKEDVIRLRAELKKIYDGLHVEFLDLRSHVWGIQQDLHSLSKKESTTTRI